MSEAVVFISHFKVKDGKLDDLKRLAGEVERSLREGKPRTTAWLVYLDEGGTKVSFVHCFPDARSMDSALRSNPTNGAPPCTSSWNPMDSKIYGRPSDEALETMRQAAEGSGVSLTVLPEHVGGFLACASG